MTADAEMSCRELVRLVTDYLEGALPPDEARRFDDHMGRCPGCRDYLEQMRTTLKLLGQLRESHIPIEGRDRLLAAFRGWASRAVGGD